MGKILKTVLICGIALCCAVLIFRIAIADHYPADVTAVIENSVLNAAYGENGEAPIAFTQTPITPYDNEEKGHFFFNSFLCIPDAKQVQVTLRYNDSTLEDIKTDMSLEEVPLGDDSRFSFYLRDGNGKLYSLSQAGFKHQFVYNYRRLVFDGIEIETSGYVYLDVYFGEADPETDAPYGSMLIYVPEAPVKNYDLPAKSGKQK